jgi:hypothetical protein
MNPKMIVVCVIVGLCFCCLSVEATVPGVSTGTQNASSLATLQPTATVTTYSAAQKDFVVNTTSVPYIPIVKKRLIIQTCEGNPAIGAKFQVQMIKMGEFHTMALDYDAVFSDPLDYDGVFEYPSDEIITGIKISYPGYPDMSISGPLLENVTSIGLCRPVNGKITLSPETFVSIMNSVDIGTLYLHTKEIKDLNQAVLSGNYDRANQVATNLATSISSSIVIMGTDGGRTYGEGDLKFRDCGPVLCLYCEDVGGILVGSVCVDPGGYYGGYGWTGTCAINQKMQTGFCAMDITLPNGTTYKASSSEIFQTGIPFPTGPVSVTSPKPTSSALTAGLGNITPTTTTVTTTREGQIITSPSLTPIPTSPPSSVTPGETQAGETQAEETQEPTPTSIPLGFVSIIGALVLITSRSIRKK